MGGGPKRPDPSPGWSFMSRHSRISRTCFYPGWLPAFVVCSGLNIRKLVIARARKVRQDLPSTESKVSPEAGEARR